VKPNTTLDAEPIRTAHARPEKALLAGEFHHAIGHGSIAHTPVRRE
jgi:hypothetical protein